MHGLFSWNTTAHVLLQKLGASKPENMKEFQARLSAPVRPGETLITEIWRTGIFAEGWEEIRFRTKVGSRQVLTNGRALMKCEVGNSKL